MGNGFFIKALLALPLAFLAVFFFYPAALVFLQAAGFLANADFAVIFSSQRFFWNSLVQAFLSTIAAFAIGFPAAYIFAKHDFAGKKLLKAMTLVPFVFPAILVAIFFVLVLGYNGIVNRILMSAFGFSDPPIKILYSLAGIVLAHAFYNFGVFVRFVSGAWEGLQEKQENAAQTLGATPWQVFFHVTLPELFPSILAAASIVFVYSFMSFAVVLTLGGVEYSNLETGIFYAVSRQADFGLAAFLALEQFVFLFFVLLVHEHASRKFTVQQESFTEKKPGLNLLQKVFVAFLALVVLVPVVSLAVFSVWGENGFSLEHFGGIFFSQKKSLAGTTPLSGIFFSLGFAAVSSVIAVLTAFLLAIYLREKNSVVFSAVAVSSLAFSAVSLGLSYMMGFGTGLWTLIVAGHAVISFPFAFKIISGALKKIPQEAIDAATLSGAGFLQRVSLVELPLAKKAIAGAAGFCFAVSLSELGLVMLLSDGKFPTMTVYIQRFISTYQLEAGAAMGLVLIFFSALCFYLIEKTVPSQVV